MALELDDDGGAPASGAAPGSGADIGSGLFDDDDDFDDMQIGFGDEDEMFGPTSGGPTSRRSQVPQLPISSILPDDISPEEVDALADYGPAPSSAFAAIGYAFRVRARRAELTELLEREHAIHDTKLNNILTGIAGMLAPLRKLDHPRVQGILAMTGAGGSVPPSSASTGGRARPVRSSTSHGDRRELAMKAEKDAVALQGAEHDEAVLTEDLKKLETKIRRLYKQAREQAGADAKVVPKEFAGPIRELTAEGKALKPKLVEVSKRVAELRKRAALSKAKAEEANREVQASSEAKRDDPDGLAAPEMTEDEREAKRLDDCDRALRRIMAELPRLVDGEDRARVASYDIEAKHLITKLELQQRALDAFDAEAERRGNVALAVLTGILVVLIAVGTQLG
jgi:hypothetical protein